MPCGDDRDDHISPRYVGANSRPYPEDEDQSGEFKPAQWEKTLETVTEDELVFLQDLMTATEFENWDPEAKEGWDKLDTDPDAAYGLTVRKGHLRKVNLQNVNLHGEIPDSVGNCRFLEKLMLNSNRVDNDPNKRGIAGTIPSSIGNCARLIRLDLSENSLEGTIPVSLGDCKKLDGVYLYDNNFSGEITSELGNCESLKFLYLGDNDFQGQIPETVGAVSELQHCLLYGNQLGLDEYQNLGNPKLTKKGALEGVTLPQTFQDGNCSILWVNQGCNEPKWTVESAPAESDTTTPTEINLMQDLKSAKVVMKQALWY
jgi:hypothetical protein